jgi:hypothetical protein
LRKGLVAAANLLAEKAKAKADSKNVPEVSKNMKVGKVESKGSGALGITISIGMKEDEAPAAAAYEFGSGLHGKEGKKYSIVPRKSGGYLVFPKERWPGYQPPPDAPDVFVFSSVMHPGVKARPYMKPAIEENKEEMKRLIGAFFTIDVIHKSIREAWYA